MSKQFSTFNVAGRLYGLDVISVQEVTKALVSTAVPLAPKYVSGLINLRGQLAVGIALRELFELQAEPLKSEPMNVVCSADGVLLALVVDSIGDVIEVEDSLFEPTPETVSDTVARFMTGVYKIPGTLLSILDVKKIVELIQK